MKRLMILIGMIMAFYIPDEESIDGEVKETPDTTVDGVLEETKMRKFLEDQAMIESSGGKNTNHKLMTGGIHKGHRAVGRYGFMPLTIQEMYERAKMEQKANPKLNELFKQKKDLQEIANSVAEDPELEDEIAKQMYRHVNARMGGDEEKMSHVWEHGHNLSSDKLDENLLNESNRVQKFRNLRKLSTVKK
jgi:hypothetical protein